MKPNKEVRKALQEFFGKGNYKLVWNHGGYTLLHKVEKFGKMRFVFYAYDAETFCKEKFGLENFY